MKNGHLETGGLLLDCRVSNNLAFRSTREAKINVGGIIVILPPPINYFFNQTYTKHTSKVIIYS